MTPKDTRPRALKIREAVAADKAAWDLATERRADAEYALEQFEEIIEKIETRGLSEAEIEERRESMRVAIRKAREGEKAAEQVWREALARAEARFMEGN
jgi:hypothetical protein